MKNKQLSQFINLKYLALGRRNRFTNDALIGLTKLEWLYLVDNSAIDPTIFEHLNLKHLQMHNVSCINLFEVPESVGNLIMFMCNVECETCMEIVMRYKKYDDYQDADSHSDSGSNIDTDSDSDSDSNIDTESDSDIDTDSNVENMNNPESILEIENNPN